MRTFTLAAAAAVAVLLLSSPVAMAADETQPKTAERKDEKPPAPPVKFVRQHRMKIGATDFVYTTTAEEIRLLDADGKPTASFFTIGYTKDGVARPQERPVTFVFNGGPGGASVALHMGLVGPKLIDIPSDAADPGAPPYKLRDNPSTILRATDLVLIDPVGTGFSHAMGAKKNEDFWGFDEDVESVAEFIRTWITEHDRWNSPKYIMGESYGGIRAALLLPRLQGSLNIGLNGAILISPALNMATMPFYTSGNDIAFAAGLPALAATAWYHHRATAEGKDFPAFLREVETFAGGDYLTALFHGDKLPAAEKQRIAERMHRYIGVSTDYIVRSDLRVSALRFAKELLRDEGKSLGLLDSRYTENELDRVGELPGNDAFMAKTGPIYASTLQAYLREELGVDLVTRYVPMNYEANEKWKRPAAGQGAFAGFIDVTGALAQATKDNEALRIFGAAGYNDMVTPYFGLSYMLDHSGIDPSHLTIRDYAGGHQMYLYRPSLETLSNDIVTFIGGGNSN